jgi:hypothetical protein
MWTVSSDWIYLKKNGSNELASIRTDDDGLLQKKC